MMEQEIRNRGVVSQQAKGQLFAEMAEQLHLPELRKLQAAMEPFGKAFHNRDDHSPQAKYAETRLSSRRALLEHHNSLLDGFPELVEILREACSHEVAAYMTDDVGLGPDQFLDLLHMVAHDHADLAALANPPARIHVALRRAQRRKEKLDRARWSRRAGERRIQRHSQRGLGAGKGGCGTAAGPSTRR